VSRNVDLTGRIFGRLTCIGKVGSRNGHMLWNCQCACGRESIVTTGNLNIGHTQSCGCLQKDRSRKSKLVHGKYHDENGNRSKLYHVWDSMKQRCNNPNNKSYMDYGGKGVKVCSDWNDYKTFYDWAISNGYQEGLTIERINNTEGYKPSNCKWIKKSMQASNRRNNHYLSFRGKKMTVTEWGNELGINPKNILTRLRRGWSVERALTTPNDRRGNDENNKAC
jgi:hypothetical protein